PSRTEPRPSRPGGRLEQEGRALRRRPGARGDAASSRLAVTGVRRHRGADAQVPGPTPPWPLHGAVRGVLRERTGPEGGVLPRGPSDALVVRRRRGDVLAQCTAFSAG